MGLCALCGECQGVTSGAEISDNPCLSAGKSLNLRYAFTREWCYDSTIAKEWNLPPDEVYRRMKRVNLIEGYILKHYEAIHAESRENITEDIAGCLLQWEKAEKQEEPV